MMVFILEVERIERHLRMRRWRSSGFTSMHFPLRFKRVA